MADDEEPVQRCTVAEPIDLRAALETAAIEHLGVDDHRIVVIYQQTILMVTVTDGEATTAQEFNVELWKESPGQPNRDSEELLTAFIDEFVVTPDTVRRCSRDRYGLDCS